jgi:hypothetical protein
MEKPDSYASKAAATLPPKRWVGNDPVNHAMNFIPKATG